MTLRHEGYPPPPAKSVGVQCAAVVTRGKITPERIKRLGHSRNLTLLWMCLVMEVKSDAIKSSIA